MILNLYWTNVYLRDIQSRPIAHSSFERMLSSLHHHIFRLPPNTLIILNRRIPLRLPTPILPHRLLPSILIRLKRLDLLTIHMLDHIIRLPLLKAKAQALVRVILVVRLILVILHLDEVRIDRRRVERQADERIDRRGFGIFGEDPGLRYGY